MGYVFVFDYNLTLETGSEVALTEGINIVKRRYGLTDFVTVEQVRELYGNPLEDFVAAFFPAGLDVSLVLSELKSELPALDKKYIRAREGAKEVLNFISFMARDPCWVLSASPGNIQGQLKAIGLYDYFVAPTTTYDQLSWTIRWPTRFEIEKTELSDFVSRAVEFCKADPLVSHLSNYRRYKDMQVIYVGDAKVDVIAVHLANKMLDYERKIMESCGWLLPKEMVISVLLDLRGENRIVIPDDMTRGMKELIKASRDSGSKYYAGLEGRGALGYLREEIDEISPRDGISIEIEPDYVIGDLRQLPWIFYPPKKFEEAIK